MKRLFTLLSLIMLIALAACGGASPEAELQPTVEGEGTVPQGEAPTTEAPISVPPNAIDPALVNIEWLWERRDPNGGATAPLEVPAPDDYNLIFNEDGTFFAQLDCNRGSGSYATPGDGSLTFQLGMTSRAFCPPESLSNDMIAMFAAARAYTIQEDGAVLAIAWADGGPVDYYRAAGAMTTTAAVDEALIGKTWQWLGTTTGMDAVTVADSTRYTIEFLAEGTATITADCNIVIAPFTADGSAISIMPGPSTLVACPEDSQGDIFTQQLSGAALYFFQDGDLYIDLFADSGTMRFGELPTIDLPAPDAGEPSGTVNAPDGIFLRTGPGVNFPSVGVAALGDSGTLIGISQDRNWYVVEAPSMPDGRVWVAATFVDAVNAENLPVVAAPQPQPNQTLVGPTWQWAATTGTQPVTVADPSRYAVTFMPDGTASIKADCNMVVAQYTATGNSLTITPGPSTLAMCPEDSQGQVFVQQLSAVSAQTLQGGELFLSLADGSTMRLVAASGGAVAPPAGGVTGGASGLVFRAVSFGPAGAEQPILAGSTVTALFDEAALSVSGSAGCNNYSGELIPQGSFFTVGPIASTMMACESPAGVMEQEAAFLAALQGTTGYRWTQQVVNNTNVITNGQLSYTLADGTTGVINFVTP